MYFLFIILIIIIIYKNNREPFKDMYTIKKSKEKCNNKYESYIRSNNYYYCFSKNDCDNCNIKQIQLHNNNINITESNDCIIYPGFNNLDINYNDNKNIKFTNEAYNRCGNIRNINIIPKNYS